MITWSSKLLIYCCCTRVWYTYFSEGHTVLVHVHTASAHTMYNTPLQTRPSGESVCPRNPAYVIIHYPVIMTSPLEYTRTLPRSSSSSYSSCHCRFWLTLSRRTSVSSAEQSPSQDDTVKCDYKFTIHTILYATSTKPSYIVARDEWARIFGSRNWAIIVLAWTECTNGW